MMHGTQRYAQTQIQTGSPVQLIVLLYDGAIQAMKLASESIIQNNHRDKARFLDRSLRVIGELSAVLNMEQGGDVARDLRRLYDYVQTELTRANLQNDPDRIQGPIRCMSTLREAWHELAQRGATAELVGV